MNFLNSNISVTVLTLLAVLITISGYTHLNYSNYSHSSDEGKSVRVSDGEVLEVRTFGHNMTYDITKITAVAGTELTLKYINEGSMPHNIIVVNGETDITPVGAAALRYSQNDYVPENEMNRITAYTKLAGPRDTVSVTFTVPDPGVYPYICTYPGHFRTMQGRLHSVAE